MYIQLDKKFKQKIANKETFVLGVNGGMLCFEDGIIKAGKQYKNGYFKTAQELKVELISKGFATALTEDQVKVQVEKELAEKKAQELAIKEDKEVQAKVTKTNDKS